jgi:enamine deaminase RidA (YjgF/YER057c/UK114 family)
MRLDRRRTLPINPETIEMDPHALQALPTFLNPEGLYDPVPNGYSHIGIPPAGARLAYIAGQGGEDAGGVLADGFRAQVRQALENLRTAIGAIGGDLEHVIKQTVLIVEHTETHLQVLGEEIARAYGPGPKPACTLIPVPRLALDGMLFEVEAIVCIRG